MREEQHGPCTAEMIVDERRASSDHSENWIRRTQRGVSFSNSLKWPIASLTWTKTR